MYYSSDIRVPKPKQSRALYIYKYRFALVNRWFVLTSLRHKLSVRGPGKTFPRAVALARRRFFTRGFLTGSALVHGSLRCAACTVRPPMIQPLFFP